MRSAYHVDRPVFDIFGIIDATSRLWVYFVRGRADDYSLPPWGLTFLPLPAIGTAKCACIDGCELPSDGNDIVRRLFESGGRLFDCRVYYVLEVDLESCHLFISLLHAVGHLLPFLDPLRIRLPEIFAFVLTLLDREGDGHQFRLLRMLVEFDVGASERLSRLVDPIVGRRAYQLAACVSDCAETADKLGDSV